MTLGPGGLADLQLLVHVELGPHEPDELDVSVLVHAEQLRAVGKVAEGCACEPHG